MINKRDDILSNKNSCTADSFFCTNPNGSTDKILTIKIKGTSEQLNRFFSELNKVKITRTIYENETQTQPKI